MKKVLKDSLVTGAFLMVLLFIACNPKTNKHQPEVTKYTCPMHPQIIKDEPGVCPICKMDLVPIHSTKNTKSNDSLDALLKPVNEVVVSKIETVKPQDGSRFSTVTARGIVNYNTNNLNSISSRVSGRIERLYVKYNYQQVVKGQKLMDVYSPDLVNAQQELLFLKRNNEPELMESAKRKLRVLGATDQQISQVLRGGKVHYSFTVYSLYSGYVAEQLSRNIQSEVSSQSQSGSVESSGSMDNMTASTSSSPLPEIGSNTPLQLREGQYISTGQKLFDLISAEKVWAEFYASPEQLKDFKRGTMVKVAAVDNAQQHVTVPVSLIQPYYKDGSKFSLVRSTIPNADKRWVVGQLLTIEIESDKQEGKWLPREAVWQTGNKAVVFVKEDGRFKPKAVVILSKSGDWLNIGNSLSAEMEVAANAWFLVDSEGFVD